MNYHEKNHGGEETARKPLGENSTETRRQESRGGGKRELRPVKKPRPGDSNRSKSRVTIQKPRRPSAEKSCSAPILTGNASKEAQVQEVLDAISSCTGKSLGVLLGTEKSPQNGNGPTNALANNEAEETSKEFIGRMEVARRLGKSLRTICYWMADGSLPYTKFKGSVIFDWDEVRKAVMRSS